MIQIRRATVDDIPVLVRQREDLFIEMDHPDLGRMGEIYELWLQTAIPKETYRAFLVEVEGETVAGAGLMVYDKPPSPTNLITQTAFIYNLYVEPPHRNQGHAHRLMEAMHQWARESGISAVALHTSPNARSLYESMGYEITDEMRIILSP
jgi:GNAT superfamily N-acetyltransferase